MPLQATSGAASQDGFGGNGVPVVPNYIEDVFSTYLYTGNGGGSATGFFGTQTITNSIDLSTKGGLVWLKARSSAEPHALFDTARGVNKILRSDFTFAQNTAANTVTAFNTTGFNLGSDSDGWGTNTNAVTYASWTFRKQPKFFDIVTYTGTGSARTIAHNLGSTPAFMIVKSSSAVWDWACYHTSLGATKFFDLNTTDAASTEFLCALYKRPVSKHSSSTKDSSSSSCSTTSGQTSLNSNSCSLLDDHECCKRGFLCRPARKSDRCLRFLADQSMVRPM